MHNATKRMELKKKRNTTKVIKIEHANHHFTFDVIYIDGRFILAGYIN